MIFLEKNKTKVYLLLGVLFFVAIALVVAMFTSGSNKRASLYFLNIGQGDSSLIELPNGVQILIDGGPSGKVLLENLAQILPPQDRYIDLLLMTHPQTDHFAGFIEVLKNYEVGSFIGSGRIASAGAYEELHRLIEEKQVPYLQLMEGDQIRIGDSVLRLLGPSRNEILSGELNDSTLVALLETPQLKALYTGDIAFAVEDRLIAKYDLDVDVLKVGHHGSRFSSGEKFLAELTPAVVVIEVGKNAYGHPTKAALDRLMASGAKILRTDKQGIIKIEPDGGIIRVFNRQSE